MTLNSLFFFDFFFSNNLGGVLVYERKVKNEQKASHWEVFL